MSKDGKNNLGLSVEASRDLTKVSINLPGKNSGETSVDKNGNISRNITVFGKTIAGDKPVDDGKTIVTIPTEPIQLKFVYDKNQAKSNYDKAAVTLKSIRDSYNIFNTDGK